ncbi:hypothetical protein SAMN05444411_101286 [Lutibacter oricola]|uniref:Glycine dehydrogenase n=1 Tax=Lutibacter oricola TaxID=762486 RepID=A0A1H2RQW5_9FLAO|nr:hypothetical protein [Lutibacter oricola]SDW21019.1 hypothetical protein SAMN05444411_101286 [Lutibacter oricola]
MKLTCDEATTICDKSQYKEASLWEIIKLNIHILLCKNCGLYSKQNSIMTKCYEKHSNQEDIKKCLGDEEKAAMEKELKAKI